MNLASEQIAGLTGGRLVGTGKRVVRFATNDHRTITESGFLFCCFAGASADGHFFLAHAVQAGATVALVDEAKLDKVAGLAPVVDLVAVPDVQAALWTLAVACRDAYSGPCLATTGSAGKTTTKNMLRAILSGALGDGLSTKGNHNNLLGVPLTLIGLSSDHAFLNLELGSNAPGEIPTLAGLARPQIAIITAVLEAHLQGFGSLDGVLREKASLGHAAGEQGVVVIPSYDPRLAGHVFPGKRVTFGYDVHDDLRIVDQEETVDGCAGTFRYQGRDMAVKLNVPGCFNLRNAAAAVLASTHAGVTCEQAISHLQAFRAEPMRMELLSFAGATWLLDAYNANPGSMEAALRCLAVRPSTGKRLAVLGAMFELGDESDVLHARVGHLASQLGLFLVAVGKGSQPYLSGVPAHAGLHIDQLADAAAWLKRTVSLGDTVLLKGSRSARVETILHSLRSEEA